MNLGASPNAGGDLGDAGSRSEAAHAGVDLEVVGDWEPRSAAMRSHSRRSSREWIAGVRWYSKRPPF
jgi:hypothetical protein